MKYFTIIDELFSSDTWIFLAIGFLAAVITSFRKPRKQTGIMCLVFLGFYAVCEVLLHFHIAFFGEFLLLFFGTAALGGAAGYFMRTISVLPRKES